MTPNGRWDLFRRLRVNPHFYII